METSGMPHMIKVLSNTMVTHTQSFTIDQGLSDMSIAGLLKAGNYIAVIHKNIIDIIDPATGKITYLDKALACT